MLRRGSCMANLINGNWVFYMLKTYIQHEKLNRLKRNYEKNEAEN